jgi:hypothetical protein
MLDDAPIPTESQRVEAWRLHTLIEAGYPVDLAEKISHRHAGPRAIDLHQAVALLRNGCRPEIAAEILI